MTGADGSRTPKVRRPVPATSRWNSFSGFVKALMTVNSIGSVLPLLPAVPTTLSLGLHPSHDVAVNVSSFAPSHGFLPNLRLDGSRKERRVHLAETLGEPSTPVINVGVRGKRGSKTYENPRSMGDWALHSQRQFSGLFSYICRCHQSFAVSSVSFVDPFE
jgi:hypothetical protein